MKRIALLETGAQEVPSLRLGSGAIHRGPLRGQLRSMVEAPIRVTQCSGFAYGLFPEIVEEPSANDFTDFRLVIG